MKFPCRSAVAIGLASWCLWAGAAPLPSNLLVTATVSLDTTNSLAPTGGATQAGTLSLTSGVMMITSSFADIPSSILGTGSLSSTLTDTGDGIGIQFSMSGNSTGGSATTDGLFGDYGFVFTNNSATETYTVTLRAAATNSVSATGADAFAFSDLRVTNGLVELFFTDHRIDTLNAGDPNVNFTLDSASNVFDFMLAPGQSLSLDGLQSQRGGVFAAGSYGASLMAFLSIDNVRVTGGGGGPGPNPVPVPGTLALFCAGLMLLGATSRRRRS